MENYKVYMHTAPNNKKYIGITYCSKPERRWKYGYGYKKQDKFYNAIKKYGWNSFKHEILYENLNCEEAQNKEKELIEKYDTINNGYNVSKGGIINNYREKCKIPLMCYDFESNVLIVAQDQYKLADYLKISDHLLKDGKEKSIKVNNKKFIIRKYSDVLYSYDTTIREDKFDKIELLWKNFNPKICEFIQHGHLILIKS